MQDYQVRTISRQQNELNAWLEGGRVEEASQTLAREGCTLVVAWALA